jgi:methionyl-tRNA formyltransferase
MKNNSVTLFLMTEKGFNFLVHAIEKYKSIIDLVVIGSDKSILRDYESEIIDECIKNNIKYVKRDAFTKVNTEYALAISWRWLIKHPHEKLIIFHDSILPGYRGYSPLVNMLINGEPSIGVSAIFGGDKFDTGDIIIQKTTKINYPIKISDAIKINNKNYLDCSDFILKKISYKEILTGSPQNNLLATYSAWRDEDDYSINWNQSSNQIKRLIDSVAFPYKGACTKLNGKIVRILEAEEFPDLIIKNRDVGKVILIDNNKPIVICGNGLLRIDCAVIEGESGDEKLLPLSKFRIRFKS